MTYLNKCFWLLCCIALASGLQAQMMSEQDISDRYQKKLQQISRKVYWAAVSGKVAGYHSDSLTTVLPAKEIQRIGTRIVPQTTNPEKFDTIAFSADSVLPAPGIVYQIIHEKSGATVRRPLAVLCAYRLQFHPGMLFTLPICYVKVADLNKVLAAEELEMLMLYAQFLQYEPGEPMLNRKDFNDEGLKFIWQDAMNRGTEVKWGTNTGRLMASWLIEQLKGPYTFRKYMQGEITLSDAKGLVTPAGFVVRHQRRFDVKMPAGDDPANLKDTFYMDMPDRFDSVFVIGGTAPALGYMMKYNFHGGAGYLYRLPQAQFARVFSPQVQRMLDILMKD